MNTTRFIRSTSVRVISIALVAALVGAGLGLGTAYAENLYYQYVPQAGNVATAGSNGWYEGGDIHGSGLSTSTIQLYYISAWARIWHQSSGYNFIQSQDWRYNYNTQGGATASIFASGYGDRLSTESLFQGTSTSLQSIYYTSYPNGSASCYTYWNSGYNC